MRSRTPIKSSLERGLKRQISSKRFKNSGLNSPCSISSSMSSSLNSLILMPAVIFSRMTLAPALEVAMMMVSRKLISRFLSSRRIPSSRTWRRVVNTEGWAFSISSSRMTEKGCFMTEAVRLN